MLSIVRAIASVGAYAAIFVLAVSFICAYVQETVAQGTELDDETLRYEAIVRQKPDDAQARKNLASAYAKKGMFENAIDEFEKAMKIEYSRGYERGKEDAIRKEGVRVYGSYLILSIAVGLLISAVIVSIFSWSEMTDKFKAMRKNARIRAFTKNIGARLAPELRHRAIEIAQRKEKLRDAISRETDSSLKEAASTILPRLDDLSRQASLLLELQQNLSDYIKDMDPIKLETAQRDCEEKLRKETDQEAKRALEYQLEQIKNKRANYSKANAKIRTCDAVLSGIAARIDATSLDLMSLPSVLIKKQEFFERVSAELDAEISLTRNATETVLDA
jgi:tetratricopeptide (TPR) repeat protein